MHRQFINIEQMTPDEHKNGGAGLNINYDLAQSPFGQILIASTQRGVCYIGFENDKKQSLNELKQSFPCAQYQKQTDDQQQNALSIFGKDRQQFTASKLHLKGSPFQQKVWESLLKIPFGQLACYSDIAVDIGQKNAARAVGGAISQNPIACLIPCHRVIQRSGKIGQYKWGEARKLAIIRWEAAQMKNKPA